MGDLGQRGIGARRRTDQRAFFREFDAFIEPRWDPRHGGGGRTLLALGLALVLTATLVVAVAVLPRARAYGNTALWQVAISGNCVNPDPAICGGGGGGFWIWAEFDTVGGNATATGCGHTGGPISAFGPPFGGAGHTDVEILAWTVGSDGTFHILGETDTVVGHGTPFTFTILSEDFDTSVPAAAGHFSFNPFPGVTFQIQVVQLT